MQKMTSIVLVTLAIICVLIPALSAARSSHEGRSMNHGRWIDRVNRRERNREHGHDCSKWEFEECVIPGGAACGRGVKKGTRTGENCRHKEKQFACKVKCEHETDAADSSKCHYKANRETAKAAPCDETTGKKTITLTLVRGDSACPQTKVVERNCRRRADRKHRERDSEHHGRDSVGHSGTAEHHRCKYTRGPWSECDADDRRKRTLTLKSGSPSDCEATKEVSRRCKTKKAKRERTGREHRRSE